MQRHENVQQPCSFGELKVFFGMAGAQLHVNRVGQRGREDV